MKLNNAFTYVAAPLFILIAAHATAPAARAADSRCTAAVQNQIAWDYEGHRLWSPTNIERLCNGSSAPAEPPRCFDKVMHGGVNWGGATKWQWENAIELCAGTSYAANTVECFEARLREGANWQTAIADCKGNAIRSARTAQSVMLAIDNRTSAPVDVFWIDLQGVRQNYGTLASGERREQQTYRGHTWQFVQSNKVLAHVVAADRGRQSVAITAQDAGEGPIWSTVDAQQKCPAICDRTGRKWTGDWTTTVLGQSSVCRCIAVAGPGAIN